MDKNSILCPCGSGKGYSECCGKVSNVVSLAQVRLRKTGQGLRQKLGEFANRYEFARDAARAQEIYFRELDDSITDYDDDFLMERCFEWFIFDFRLPNGERLIDKFAASAYLNSEEKKLVEEWRRAPNSLYEVKTVFPGKGMLLEDLFLREQLAVMDVNAINDISAGYILYMRVLPVGNENEFSTSGLALPGECKGILMNKILADAREYMDRGWSTYLRERSHIVNSIVMQVSLNPGLEWFKFEQGIYQDNDYQESGEGDGLMTPADFPWREESYQLVAREVVRELYNFRYDQKQLNNALQLWYDYSSMERPVFRKPEVWIATIIYAVFRLERDHRQNQHTLAELYGVSPSTISGKYRSVCRVLGLEDCDRRYSTCTEKLKGKANTVSFLSRLLSKKK